MPVKRRRSKQLMGYRPDAWECLFTCGWDFFQDTGCRDDAEAREQGREVWKELVAAFMESWTPTINRSTPWALETYGPPPCR